MKGESMPTPIAFSVALVLTQLALPAQPPKIIWRNHADAAVVMHLLLENVAIQQELELVAYQADDLKRAAVEYQREVVEIGKQSAVRHPNRMSTRAAYKEYATELSSGSARAQAKLRSRFEDVLQTHQVRRLNELYVQFLDVEAFAHPFVRVKLGLSEQQRALADQVLSKLRKDLDEARSAEHIDPFADTPPVVPPKPLSPQQARERTELAIRQIIESLNAQQKVVFQELIGKPFDQTKLNAGRVR
jgi:hypothetical protein